MNPKRWILRSTARALVAVLTLSWSVLPVVAQDQSEAATRQYMQQRVDALKQSQQRLAAEFEAARQSDPQRAEYLARLMQENQVLEQRYNAYLQGGGAAAPADSTVANSAPPAGEMGGAPGAPEQAGGGGMGDMLKGMMGGGSTTDLIGQGVAGLGGWYLGKMAFGPIGGIVGGFVAPMLAKWIMGKVKEMRGEKDEPGKADPYAGGGGVPMTMGGQPESAHGAPVYNSPEKAAAQSASIAQAKGQMDAAYLALMDAMNRGMAPAEIAQRRNTYEQWQVVYNQAIAGAR